MQLAGVIHIGGGAQNRELRTITNYPRKFAPTFPTYDEVSAAMESSARFVVVLLLRHLAAAEFTENRD